MHAITPSGRVRFDHPERIEARLMRDERSVAASRRLEREEADLVFGNVD